MEEVASEGFRSSIPKRSMKLLRWILDFSGDEMDFIHEPPLRKMYDDDSPAPLSAPQSSMIHSGTEVYFGLLQQSR